MPGVRSSGRIRLHSCAPDYAEYTITRVSIPSSSRSGGSCRRSRSVKMFMRLGVTVFASPITVCATRFLGSREASESAELQEAMDVSTYG